MTSGASARALGRAVSAGCLPSTANDQPSDAFLAIAPDGTRYWLNQLVYGYAPQIAKLGGSDVLLRAAARFWPYAITTRVTSISPRSRRRKSPSMSLLLRTISRKRQSEVSP